MVIQKGHTYSISFLAHATKPIQMKGKVGMSGPPYKEYWTDTVDLTTHPQTFVGAFTMESGDDATAELAFHFGGGFAGESDGAVHRLLRRHPPRRSAVHEIGERLDRGGANPERARQPDRLSARAAQAGHGQDALQDAAQVGAAQEGRRRRRVRRDEAVRQGRRLGRRRADRRLLVVEDAGQGLHALGQRRRQPPVRHRQGRLQEAEVRRARVLLSDPQRHRDQDAVRRRQAVDAPGRSRRRGAQPRGQERPLPAGFGLRLQARRQRRLVRRRRSGEVRRQRRDRGLDADE